jgi:hypothetical protein
MLAWPDPLATEFDRSPTREPHGPDAAPDTVPGLKNNDIATTGTQTPRRTEAGETRPDYYDFGLLHPPS